MAGVTRIGDIFSVTLARYPPTVVGPSGWISGPTRMDAERRKEIHEAMVQLSDGDRTAFNVPRRSVVAGDFLVRTAWLEPRCRC